VDVRQKDLKIAEKFKALVAHRAKVHEVKIFGSRARGNATDESDLDVLVVVDHLDHGVAPRF
jgi:predicted nucleotidyltransferase